MFEETKENNASRNPLWSEGLLWKILEIRRVSIALPHVPN